MATPRSAGRVLIKPMGDYNPATTYEMLDAVEYDGSTYLCKQTSTGNLPTNKTYWQKMISVGANDFMVIDGSNADNVIFGGESYMPVIYQFDMSKPAGAEQTITMTANVPQKNNKSKIVRYMLEAHVNGPALIMIERFRNIIIDTVAVTTGTTDDAITVTAHLVTDIEDAISLTGADLFLLNYVKDHFSFVHGEGCTSKGQFNHIVGAGSGADSYWNCVIGGNSFAHGNSCMVIGSNNYATDASYAFGRGLEALNANFAIGRYNNRKSSNIFEVGGGTVNARKNILEIKSDGSFSNNDGVDYYKFAKSSGKDGFYNTDGTFYNMGYNILEQQVTLSTSADTTVTFTNGLIKADSMIDVYTDVFGINPSAMTATTGSATLTFPKADTAQTITVRLVLM